MENRFLDLLIAVQTDVDKYVDAFQECTNAVKKFFRDKLILVFHNNVLKQAEECKTLGKFPATFPLKPINPFVENYFCKLSARSSNSL